MTTDENPVWKIGLFRKLISGDHIGDVECLDCKARKLPKFVFSRGSGTQGLVRHLRSFHVGSDFQREFEELQQPQRRLRSAGKEEKKNDDEADPICEIGLFRKLSDHRWVECIECKCKLLQPDNGADNSTLVAHLFSKAHYNSAQFNRFNELIRAKTPVHSKSVIRPAARSVACISLVPNKPSDSDVIEARMTRSAAAEMEHLSLAQSKKSKKLPVKNIDSEKERQTRAGRRMSSLSISSGSPELGPGRRMPLRKSTIQRVSKPELSNPRTKPDNSSNNSPKKRFRSMASHRLSSSQKHSASVSRNNQPKHLQISPQRRVPRLINTARRIRSLSVKRSGRSLVPNYSPRKTRAIKRQEEDGIDGQHNKCVQCHVYKPVEELRQCPGCSTTYHLGCMQLEPETIRFINTHASKWRCAHCIVCRKCEEPIADPGNVQCMHCARAWHGECRPKRSPLPQFPYHRWACEACKHLMPHEHTPESRCGQFSPTDSDNEQYMDSMLTSATIERRANERQSMQSERNKTLRPTLARALTQIRAEEEQEQRAMKLEAAKNKHASSSAAKSVRITEPIDLESVREREQRMKLHKWMNGVEEEEEPAADEESKISKKQKGQMTNPSQQKKKQKPLLASSPQTSKRTPGLKPTPRFVRKDQLSRLEGGEHQDDDTDIMAQQMRVLSELGFTPNTAVNRNTTNEWVQFGQFVRYRPLYQSAYQEPIRSARIIYVCEFCLMHMVELDKFRSHVMFCPWRYPPGNEIYRNTQEGWNIWEVEGNQETAYCRNLCLMAKLFLASKTLYHEVDTFTFYLLTEITPRGCVLVGYFSKEKNPSKNNNLSCLLTMPNAQSRGYGKLLVDLSYQMSKLEHKIGHPEHPLSDMGLLAYRSYWRSVLFSALRQRRNCREVSIKDLSAETAIHNADIVSTLLANGMLLFRNDSYHIDITKALNASLAMLRRRTIQADQLRWLPQFEVNPHSKMNSYAVD